MTRTHERCKANPGYRVIWIRKTLISLKRTILPGFELDVAPNFPWANPGASRSGRSNYLYPNASEITLCGMDNPLALRSGEFDELNYFESHEGTLNQWEEILGSIRRFSTKHVTATADTNPAHKGHFLYQRSRRDKRMRVFASRHWMNPKYFDARANEGQGDWTPEGRGYVLGTLANLTGARRARLFLGWWVSQSGQMWETFDESVNVIPARAVPGWNEDPAQVRPLDWYFASVDWGWTHAGVMQVWGVRHRPKPIGFEMYRVCLVYRMNKGIDWWARVAKILTDRYRLQAFVCDPGRPENIDALNREVGKRDGEWIATAAKNKHNAASGNLGQDMGGLDTVRWLLRDHERRSRMFFVEPDEAYLQDPDPEEDGYPMGGPCPLRQERAKPVSDVEEIPDYLQATAKDGAAEEWAPDRPADKQDDDGCDATRYAAVHANTNADYTAGSGSSRFEPETWGDVLGHGQEEDEE